MSTSFTWLVTPISCSFTAISSSTCPVAGLSRHFGALGEAVGNGREPVPRLAIREWGAELTLLLVNVCTTLLCTAAFCDYTIQTALYTSPLQFALDL